MKNKIYLGLGSNVGDRAENIISALSFLQSSGLAEIKKVSSLYETSPVGPKQRSFYNAAAEAETILNPLELLILIKEAERLLGRRQTKRWGPRVIDIDILFYGDKIIKSEEWRVKSEDKTRLLPCRISTPHSSLFTLPLEIPHPEISKRLFVLIPLNEIAPELVHPTLNRKINAILNENLLTLADQKVKIIQNY